MELWQIKGEGVCGAGFKQSIGFVVIRSGHIKDVKRTRKYSDTRKCRKEFLKYIMGFSEKHRVIFSKRLVNTKVISGGPKPDDVLIFSSFFRLFGQKIEKTGLTCLKSYQGGKMRLSALCVW